MTMMPILAGSSLSVSTRGWPVFGSRLRSGSSIEPAEPRAARAGIAKPAARTSSARPRQAGALPPPADLLCVILITSLQVETNNPKISTADSHQISADSSPFLPPPSNFAALLKRIGQTVAENFVLYSAGFSIIRAAILVMALSIPAGALTRLAVRVAEELRWISCCPNPAT